MVSANDGHVRCVHWTHLNPFHQVTDGTFRALSDTPNLFDLVRQLKLEIS
jgi:hypothetical protein